MVGLMNRQYILVEFLILNIIIKCDYLFDFLFYIIFCIKIVLVF